MITPLIGTPSGIEVVMLLIAIGIPTAAIGAVIYFVCKSVRKSKHQQASSQQEDIGQ